MKTISLTQPWATLIAIGAKTIETRSWTTTYRGPLAIHAAKSFPACAKNAALAPDFTSHLWPGIWYWHIPPMIDALPRGMVIATCELVACVRTDDIYDSKWAELCTPQELAFGDYTYGRYAWILRDVQPLAQPILARGTLGLWEWDAPEEVSTLG